ncbi:MAG: Asp-tRNA(Asn)/Glu-tRNA(Gln) amidotransferase GatCAB subunit C [Candidatus Hydrothermota bacterium]|nr:MAG: Asp-tRNA(Asn)/Glu-tRNA(Gln) amidotransferase GatCAB subunit C [Candidatus Hydrothermae bacterium]
MEIDVKKIAELAKLSPSPQEAAALEVHFKKMLKYFQKLQELDLSDVEPLTNPHEFALRMRDDEPKSGLDRESVLRNAPDRHENFYRVPSPLKEVRKEK